MTPNKCENYVFCENTSEFNLDGKYLCEHCKYIPNLTFEYTTEECPICFEVSRCFGFPSGCNHRFCITCTRKIVLPQDHYFFLSRVPYGCEPCPNGCDNPERGLQCNCEEYDVLVEKWETDHEDLFGLWSEEEAASVEAGINNTSFGSGKCPLCRSIFDNFLFLNDYSDSDGDFIDDSDCDTEVSSDTYSTSSSETSSGYSI